MRTLILHPTSTAQWVALVQEATHHSKLLLKTELEHYLVFLLMHYINRPEIAQQVFATNFLMHQDASHPESLMTLQDIGDQCLLYSGLFPKKAQSRRVGISYYVHLGQQAYDRLSTRQRQPQAELFSNLCEHFISLMDVLHSIRSLNPDAETLDLIEAEDLWRQTKSQQALKILKRKTQGFFLPNHLVDEHQKH